MDCPSRQDPQSFLEKTNDLSHVKKVIGVVSGKGGVGKSLVTSLLATTLRRRENEVAVLDADITGPSIPKCFGMKQRALSDENGIYPVSTKTGIKVMSVNLLLEEETSPVVWRGPVIAGAIKQFWTDVIWGNVDYMFVDMPPGTGDAPLTVFQSLPLDGILIVNKTYSLPSDFDPGKLDDTAEKAFEQLQADAAKEGLDIYIGSDFRSYSYQVDVYESYCETYGWEMADTFSARPGFSEHQTGLTIDCNTIDDAFGQTKEAQWLAEHCADYGFIIRFPDGKEDITGYQYEPWHIRYVGVDTAKEIDQLGVSLEEYLGVQSEYTGPWEH